MIFRQTLWGILVAAGLAFAVAGFTLALSGPAAAQFYKGKTVTVLINFAAGGATDLAGRVAARHLGKHVPGQPRVVAKNMPGAGGLIGWNYLGEKAKRDGLTLGYFIVASTQPLLNDPSLRVKLHEFDWLAGFGNPQVCYVRKDVPPGINQPADLTKVELIKAGGIRGTTSMDLRIRLSLDLLGVKHKVVTGYRGVSKIRTALLQNELQYACVTVPGYRSNIVPSFIKPGIGMPSWHYGVRDASGKYVRSERAKDVVAFHEVYQQVHGKMPSGMMWDAMTQINELATRVQRAMTLPPGSPAEAVRDMRKGVDAMIQDPAFRAEYTKIAGAAPDTLNAAETQGFIDALKSVDPKIVAFLRTYAGLDK